MITAYIDESGIAPDERYVCVGGFIASDEVWELFNREWSERLRESGLTYFHMAEFKADRPPFCPPTLNRAAHTNLELELFKIIQRHQLFGCIVRVDQLLWDKIIVGFNRRLFGDAVAFALSEAGFLMHEAFDKRHANQKLRICYGESHLEHHLATFVETYRRSSEGMPLRFDGVSFKSMKNSPGIQASDALLWEFRKQSIQLIGASSDSGYAPLSRNLALLAENVQVLYYDLDEIIYKNNSVVSTFKE